MPSAKINTAYSFFFIFFGIWITVLWLTCFPSGAWANPVRFFNFFVVVLFILSGSIAAVACAVIGIDYLGINFRSRPGDSIQTVGSQSPVVQKSRELVVKESRSDTANIEKLQEPPSIVKSEETELDVLVLLPAEEEETAPEMGYDVKWFIPIQSRVDHKTSKPKHARTTEKNSAQNE